MRVSDKTQKLQLSVEVENNPMWLTLDYGSSTGEPSLSIEVRDDDAEWPNEFTFLFAPKDKDALACVIDALQKAHADMCVQNEIKKPARDGRGRARYECKEYLLATEPAHEHKYCSWQPVVVIGKVGVQTSPFYYERMCPCGHRDIKHKDNMTPDGP